MFESFGQNCERLISFVYKEEVIAFALTTFNFKADNFEEILKKSGI